jgi:glucose/mannose-6-phosphate isomerase
MDRSDMLGRAAALPQQCRDGWSWGLRWEIPASWSGLKQILVLGVGGSAIGGDLLQGIVGDRLKRPIIVNRSYSIPGWVDRQTLILACSYSGNTEETLSATEEAAKRGARIAAVTSGGRLYSFSQRRRFPVLKIPTGWPPRAAIGFQLFAPLGLLVRLGWIAKKALPVEESCDSLERFILSKLAPQVSTSRNPAKRLARTLQGRLPVIYGASGGWEGVTYRWRTQLEENAKTLAFHHLFPEATHNEISGWVEPTALLPKMAAIFLTDPAIHPRIRRRMLFTSRIVRSQGAKLIQVNLPGRYRLERLLQMIALGDFTSIYLAFLHRVDPTPVKRVEALKRFMGRDG